MEILHNAVAWAEIPVTDFDRAKKFYESIYDFQMTEMEMGPARMGFLQYDQESGGVGAAIISGDENSPSQKGVRLYLNGGSDLNIVLNRVESAGGHVILGKTEITPEFGFFAIFQDTEGNHISLHSMG